jgi:hypothetical protein
MKKNNFENLESGLFDSSKLESSQLKYITGGKTTYSTFNSGGTATGGGNDTYNSATGYTSYTDGTESGGGRRDNF